jgi:hypothetical protein
MLQNRKPLNLQWEQEPAPGLNQKEECGDGKNQNRIARFSLAS